ncbi:hypothetical protein NUU61_006053 [Penicillium alfredii]|uniref:F-box domain-containing protein n=1 Tax=Penicillium alfredii TaxID=1506179 RepID=A0A9W9K2Z5_9EURO|nr:uncharacterized protein NUU61_006053 [Penicillium alfredii]KAJ5091183.1 hypothetical protein NUU61_006053 [Penicillium alfredii]
MESFTSHLLELPPEILEAVLLALPPSSSRLAAVSCVCRRLHFVSIPLLYRSVALRSPEHGKQFCWTVRHGADVIPHVRELQIHYHETDDESDDCPEDLYPVFTQLVNLESLVVRSDWFDPKTASRTSLISGPQEVLPNLRCCNLGYDYYCDGFWALDPYQALFYHSGLRKFAITGAKVQARWQYLPTQKAAPRSTQLEELQFLNCDIPSFELQEMLQYPRALKHFTLKGETPIQGSHGPRIGEPDRMNYINALHPHSSSLETLDLDLYREWEWPVKLHGFTALKQLTITPRMLIGDDPEGRPRAAAVPRWEDVLPSGLEKLVFRNDEPELPLLGIYETVRDGFLPHLRLFTCEVPSNRTDDSMVRAYECTDGIPSAQAFARLGVQFSLVQVPDSTEMPENKAYPCQCWIYRHRPDDKYAW